MSTQEQRDARQRERALLVFRFVSGPMSPDYIAGIVDAMAESRARRTTKPS